MQTVREIAKAEADAYLSAGYDLVPLVRGGKEPRDKGWRSRDYGRRSLMTWLDTDGNVGVRLRLDQLVIDADPRNYPAGRDVLAELIADLGLPEAPRVETGSGGEHLYYTLPPDRPTPRSLDSYPGIDFKSFGFQVVAAGALHPSGERYTRDDFAPVFGAEPRVPEALLDRFREAMEGLHVEGAREVGRLDREGDLAKLLEHLEVLAFREHDDWLQLMMSCVAASGGSEQGREEFVAWSTSDPMYSGHGNTIRKRWASLRPEGPVTEATLYKYVIEAGGGKDLPPMPADATVALTEIECEEGNVRSRTLAALEEMNDRFAVVYYGGQLRIYTKKAGQDLFLKPADFHVEAANLPPMAARTPTGNPTAIPASKKWLTWDKRREFADVVFDPERDREGVLNLYRGYGVDPVAGDWSPMRDHIMPSLFGRDTDYVMRWCAFAVQKPWLVPETALVLKGSKGKGKGTFGRAMVRLFGRAGVHISHREALIGKFNSHLARSVVVFADEASWPGDKQSEGILNALITEPTLQVEEKFQGSHQQKNFVHLIMASNHQWVVPASADERRYVVFDVDERQRPGDDVFRAWAELGEAGLAAMLDELLSMDIEGWHPRHEVPYSQALERQITETVSRDPMQAYWLHLLEDGEIPGLVDPAQHWNGQAVLVWAHVLFEDYAGGVTLPHWSGGMRSEQTRFGVFLKRNLGARKKRMQIVKGGERGYAYLIPPLEKCRIKLFPQVRDWEDYEVG